MYKVLIAFLVVTFAYGQAPQGFNYQGVIRDANGNVLANQSVTLAFGIVNDANSTSPIYSEQLLTTTDQVGQVSLIIGNGENQTGNFTSIDWSQSPYFLSISVNIGSGFVSLGSIELLSVPFAMYAQTSGNIPEVPSLNEVLSQGNDADLFVIENLGAPINDFDAANKFYVDPQIQTVLEEVSENALPQSNGVGDMLIWDGENWVSLPAGDQGQQLVICNGLPTWATNGECPQDGENTAWPKDASTVIIEVTSTTGKIWMDRNLGASNASTNVQNESSYGHLYQWGRSADGHQLRTSGTSNNLSTVLIPEHESFIFGHPNWLNSINNSLWQGEAGENNPCPDGFRIPTVAELEAERVSWNQNNANGAFASVLKLSVAGRREHDTGNLFAVNSNGYYWSSTIDGNFVQVLNINSNLAQIVPFVRARGYSVRCIKDD